MMARMQSTNETEALRARTRGQLVEAVEAGAPLPKWLMFWGHQAGPDGSVGKGCLSQWWPCSFTVEGIAYASAEHWMMAGFSEGARRIKADLRSYVA